MQRIFTYWRFYRAIRNIFLFIVIGFLTLSILLFLLFKIPAVQNWASQRLTHWLGDKLQTTVTIGKVDIELFNHMVMEDLYIEDRQQDTLLFAGRFEVNIGSFNPFKRTIKLKNIALQDAILNINRTLPDSIYNYSFLMEAFESGSTDTIDTSTGSGNTFSLSLNRVTIENTQFRMYDGVSFEEFDVYIHDSEILINNIDLKDHIIALEKVEFEKANVGFASLLDSMPNTDEDTFDTIHIALGDWQMELTQLLLKDCAFSYKNEYNIEPVTGINFNDIDATHINIHMYDVLYVGDTVLARINQIAFVDKSGFELDTFKTKLLFSPYEITLSDLKITTPHSRIQDAFAMTFTTLNDFDRIESDVRFAATFNQTEISATDLDYFIGGLGGHDELLAITAKISGPMNNLKMRDLEASVESIAGLKGTINVRGLPVLDETFVDIEMEPLFVDFNKVEQLVGTGKLPQEVINLGNVQYDGRVTGFVYDLVAYGNFTTSQGKVETDLNFIYNKASGNSQFAGKFNTTELNIGVLAGQEILGKVSMTANIDGGIVNKEPEFKMESNIQSIGFNNYTYSNIKVNGELKNKFFEGKFSIDDPNIKMDFSGLVDFSGSVPAYDFFTTFRGNLQPLNFYAEDVSVMGRAKMVATGKTIDDLDGFAGFSDLFIIKGRDIYKLDTLAITSLYEGKNKIISAESDLIDLRFEGQFETSKLPATFKHLVNHYTKDNDTTTLAGQEATFTIKIKNADRLAAIFYPDIKVIRDVDISGNMNTATNDVNARVRVQQFGYQSMLFDTILFEAKTVANTLQFFAKVNQTHLGKTTDLPTASVEGTFANNDLAYIFKLGSDTDSNRMDLHGEIHFEDEFIALTILPSEIFYNNQRWDILENNSLKIDDHNLLAENFSLTSGDQMINLSSAADSTYGTILKLDVRNIPINDIVETFILPGEGVSGKLTGNVTIGNIFDNPSFIGRLEVFDFTMNEKNYGKLRLETVRLEPSNKIKISAGLAGSYGFNADGFYTPATANEEASLTADIQFNKTPLSLVEPFIRGILSDLSGDIIGNIKIEGPMDELAMQGSLKVQKGNVRIAYIGATYLFDSLRVNIDKNRITVPPQTIRDKRNNRGILEGAIGYNNFSNWDFKKLSLTSEKIELLNVTKKENQDFWGYAVGKVNANITGGLDDLLITVEVTPSDSIFYLPAYGSGNVKRHDFIKFINKSAPDTIIEELNLSIVNVDLIVNITPAIEAKILINSEGTEFLSGKGFGTLHIEANTLGTIMIDGELAISDGYYDFSFQNLFPRRFELSPGGTIKFNGDAYKARFDLVATSRIKDVSVSTLTGTSTTEKADIDVLVLITGTLESPVIEFDLEVVENTAVGGELQQAIAQVKSDKNEVNKQVFGLLITKEFLPRDLTSYNPVGSTVNNTMNDFISSQLSIYFENVLNEFLKNAEVDVGISQMEGDYIYTTKQGQQFEFSIRQEIARNLIVKVGTTYSDLGGANAQGATSNLAGDFELEYILSEDGRVRLKAFRISEYDAIIAKNDVKTGVGIYYTKEFDKLNELWQRDPEKLRRKKLKSEQAGS